MQNNINRGDPDRMIAYLQQPDPKLTHGPLLKEFEQEWSRWLGVKHSVILSSGSSANGLTMMALRELKGPGEVIVPPLTWVSDISAVIRAGLEPVFVDIDRQSLALDPKLVPRAITPRTKAVSLTHILGFNGLTNELIYRLSDARVILIEDACESHGATHNGEKVGSLGWASNFSLYYAHHMTTIEGGMVSTNYDELNSVLRMMRFHGMVRESLDKKTHDKYTTTYLDLNPNFIFAFASHKMRPTELDGLLGLEQLERLDGNNQARTRNFKRFLSVLDLSNFQTDFKFEGSSNYAFTLVLNEANGEKEIRLKRCSRKQELNSEEVCQVGVINSASLT